MEFDVDARLVAAGAYGDEQFRLDCAGSGFDSPLAAWSAAASGACLHSGKRQQFGAIVAVLSDCLHGYRTIVLCRYADANQSYGLVYSSNRRSALPWTGAMGGGYVVGSGGQGAATCIEDSRALLQVAALDNDKHWDGWGGGTDSKCIQRICRRRRAIPQQQHRHPLGWLGREICRRDNGVSGQPKTSRVCRESAR